jgi:hypothetical protein
MHGIDKSSIWTAAGFAFVCGLVLLPPTQASAQFNIDGLIRGALQQGCCYGPEYRSRSTSRHTKSHANDDAVVPDKSKEKDARDVEAPSNGAPSNRQTPAGPASDASRSAAATDSPAKPQNAPKGNDDQPAFAPSR